MSDKKITSAESVKLQHIIDMTEAKIGKIKFNEIKESVKEIPNIHEEDLEKAVHSRNVEDIGRIVLMGIYQVEQDKIKKAVYQWII